MKLNGDDCLLVKIIFSFFLVKFVSTFAVFDDSKDGY